jgi:hypothetical protein
MSTIRELEVRIRSLEAENKKLKKALEPMVEGTYWITAKQVADASRALGMKEQKV